MGNIAVKQNYKHRCTLHSEEETLSIEGRRLCRSFRAARLLSSKPSHRKVYSISRYAGREERRYHLEHYFYIIHPFSNFRYYWDIFMIIIFLLQLLSVPYILNMDSKPMIIHYVFVTNIICLVNICVNFTTGYYESIEMQIILNPRKIAIKYLKSYFILDMLASFPYSYVCYLSGVSELSLRAVSSLRLLHAFSLMLYMDRLRQKLHWVTCFIGFALINDTDIGFEDLDVQYCLRTSLYLVFGLGHSDFTLFGTEMIVQCLTMVFTVVMRIIVTAQIILLFKSNNALRRKYSQMMSEVDEFVHFKSVPMDLRLKMQQYFHFMYQDMYHNETEVWSRVSGRMKAIVHLQVLRQWLETDIFQLCPADTVLALMNHLQRRIVLTDELIYTSGSAAEYVYLLHYGRVALYTQSGRKVLDIEEGNTFGDAALLTYSTVRRFTVITLECCVIFRIHRKFFFFAIHHDAELERNVQIVLERRKQLLEML
ncbi:I[[h]] channel [Carabus blaptoides fortunei]